jgi:hypothetical protein
MEKKQTRGLEVHFTDGSKASVSFLTQTEDQYRRKLGFDEIIKKRTLVVEADGATYVVPFENIKYIRVFPAPEFTDPTIIKGASFTT